MVPLATPFRRALLIFGLLLSTSAGFAQDALKPIVATDLLKIRELDDVDVSPDGRHIVYTVKRIVETPDGNRPYAYRTHLYYVSLAGDATPRPLTRGERSASQPDWHPESDRLAFVRTVKGNPQIFVLSLSGGEPMQVTHSEHGATNPRWSPDGSRILFTARLPGSAVRDMSGHGPRWPRERPGRTPQDTVVTVPPDTLLVLRDSLTSAPLDTLAPTARPDSIALLSDSLAAFPDTITVPPAHRPPTAPNPDGSLVQIRNWLDAQRQQNNPRVFSRIDLHGEHTLQPDLTYRYLFVVGVGDDGATSAPQPITQGFYDFGGGTWLPSGNQVLLHGAIHPNEHPDRVRNSDLFIADADSQNVRRLLRLTHYALYAPNITPDGTTISFLARDLRDPGYAQTEVGLFALDGRSAPELITTDFDRSVRAPRWSPDGWYLYFTAASNGGFPLYRMAPFAHDTTTGAPPAPDTRSTSGSTFTIDSTMTHPLPATRLTSYARGVRSYDVTTASAYYVVTEATNPYELYANNADFTNERRLSTHNATWLENKRLSQPTSFTVRRDSLDIQGWVMKPASFSRTRSYPLLVEIHGGPAAMWGPGEATMWHEFQFMAARGYGIVYSNPRGSGGYGHAFKKANYQNWGTGPMDDVLAAADTALSMHSWLDPSWQVVTGGSYAGYLTAWTVSQTHRFKAAVAQRGVYDLPTFMGEGNAWRLVPHHFGGYPWQGDRPAPIGMPDSVWAARDTVMADSARGLPPRAALLRNSPVTYVDQIRTPLLIMHADDDLRTGAIQSEVLYKSLKILDRPVEYVRYPDAGHDLSRSGDPQQRIDRLLRIYEFMERFIDSAPQRRTPTTAQE